MLNFSILFTVTDNKNQFLLVWIGIFLVFLSPASKFFPILGVRVVNYILLLSLRSSINNIFEFKCLLYCMKLQSRELMKNISIL